MFLVPPRINRSYAPRRTMPLNESPEQAAETPEPRPAPPAPRSRRDLEALRGLRRRIPPDDAGAHNNLGVVFYQKGLIDDAVAEFERALELDDRMEVARRNIEIAYFHTGHLEHRIAQLRARLERVPNDFEAADRLARAYLYSGDATAAADQWRRVVERWPERVDVHIRLARAEEERGNRDAALAYLDHAARAAPDDATVHLRLGEFHFARGLYHEAQAALERAIALDDELAAAHNLLAFVYADLGLEERSEVAARRAMELNPSVTRAEENLSLDRYGRDRQQELAGPGQDGPEAVAGTLAHYNMGLAFRQRGLHEEALREFVLAQERGEDPSLVRQAVAEQQLLMGRSEEATALYEELTAHGGDSPKLWNERGVAEHQSGEADNALALYSRALELDPEYVLAQNNRAVALIHTGDTEAGERALRRACRAETAPAEVWRNLGLLLMQTGRRQDALETYQAATEAEPASGGAWTGLGSALLELGRAQEARTALVRAVETDPLSAEARYHLAFALSALGDYEGALAETRRALELDPFYPAPRYRLLIDLQFEEAALLAPELDAMAVVRAGDAVPAFEPEAGEVARAFDGLETATAVADPLAAAEEALARGQLDRAAEAAQRAAVAGADAAEQLLLQGEIYLRQGLAGEALERFAAVGESVAGERAGRAWTGVARAALDLGRALDALDAADRALAFTPGDLDALRVRARSLSAAGRYAEAAETLEMLTGSAADVSTLTELGRAYLGAGRVDAAEQALRAAVAEDEGALAARVALGHILARTERTHEASRQYEAALEVLPSYADAALPLAELHRGEGRLQDAVRVLVDLLSVDPYHLDALARLGMVLHEAGRREQAVTALTRVLRIDPGHEAAAVLARITPAEPKEA